MTPSELATAARDLIARPDAATAGVWPRTSALLARQAIELAATALWESLPETAGLASCNMRSQLTCLPSYIDQAVARQAAYTWAALSNACHYHPYELAPTAAELTRWIDDTAELITRIADRITRAVPRE
jgi:hypothetical protein